MPPDFSPRFQLAGQLLSQRKFEQARQVFLKILQQAPGHPDAANGIAIALEGLGQLDQALYHAQRAAAARPTDGAVLNTLASLLTKLERFDESIALLRKARELEPGLAAVRGNLVNGLWNAGRCAEATDELRQMLVESPGDPSVVQRLATKLTVLARAPEGVALCRSVLPQAQHDCELTRALSTCLLNDPSATTEQVVEGHRLAGAAILHAAGGHSNPVSAFPNTRDPTRPLRIGFVSPDFRQHSVSFFVESLIERLDRRAFQILLYSNADGGDSVTARLRKLASEFKVITAMDDATVGAAIVQDRVDILIDLAGHTMGSRLGIFALRAAPIQMTYCGYPATTGLPTVDVRVVDSSTDPEGSDAHCAERLVRLDPSFLCYRPPTDAPAPAPAPSITQGHVTFGSFNATSKLNDDVIALWSRVLMRVPRSRLVLKAHSLADPAFREYLHASFEKYGVARDGVEFLPATKGIVEHLATYARVDIGLDPFPYHGTTTTCEAAHMGVPTITLRGSMHHSRVGPAILNHLGLADLVASTPEEYVSIAARLADDATRRASIRTSLRSTLAASPLGNADAFAARFAAMLRSEWVAFCENRR
jgi:predicted O-linked N-acetylglucosamine transferase (SPINDLY family)